MNVNFAVHVLPPHGGSTCSFLSVYPRASCALFSSTGVAYGDPVAALDDPVVSDVADAVDAADATGTADAADAVDAADAADADELRSPRSA